MVYIVPNENEFKSDPTAKLTGEGNVIVFKDIELWIELSSCVTKYCQNNLLWIPHIL